MAEPVPAVGSHDAAVLAAAAPDHSAAAALVSRFAEPPSPPLSAPTDGDAAADAAVYDREARLATDGATRARLLVAAGRLHAGPLRDPAAALQRYREACAADANCSEAMLAFAQGELAEALAEGRHEDRVRAL